PGLPLRGADAPQGTAPGGRVGNPELTTSTRALPDPRAAPAAVPATGGGPVHVSAAAGSADELACEPIRHERCLSGYEPNCQRVDTAGDWSDNRPLPGERTARGGHRRRRSCHERCSVTLWTRRSRWA